MKSYTTAQSEARARLNIARSPATLLDILAAFVDECENGYSWDISEYNNELRARDELGEVIAAPELQSYEEHAELVAQVEVVDARFKALILEQASIPRHTTWWRRAILRFAGKPYAEYIEAAYGVHVECRT